MTGRFSFSGSLRVERTRIAKLFDHFERAHMN
jgi:hypothetical protein